MIKTYLNGVLLPVNPLEDITVKATADNKQYDIVNLGEVSRIGKVKLKEITIKSIFTDNVYPFSVTSSPLPAKTYVNNIYSLMAKQLPARLIVTGDGVDINLLCSIESFEPSQHQAETNEYYYTLALKEYREPSVKRVKIVVQSAKSAVPKASAAAHPVRSTRSAPKTRTYTVKRGDCLWNIAKKYYGSGTKYTKIVAANKGKIKNPSLIYSGWVLTIP
jgi:nucleoid-associated protein YgaU